MKLLLHICCGPCATASIKKIQSDGFEVVGYYYNPNIYPKEEYQKRLAEAKKLASDLNIELIIPEYNSEEYFKAIAINGDCLPFDYVQGELPAKTGDNFPKPSLRCPKCWELRIAKTAEKARELGIKTIATTLRISPYQDQETILSIGTKIANENKLFFYDKELASCFSESVSLSKGRGMYRQKYCGCIFSREYK